MPLIMQTISELDTKGRGGFSWPQVASSPKNIQQNKFYDKTAELLERTVTPQVRKSLTKKNPNRGNIKECYKSSEAISDFIREVFEEFVEETTLSPGDCSRLSALLVANLQGSLVNSMVTQLSSPAPVNRVLFDDEAFDACRERLIEGKEELLSAQRQKNALTSNVQKVVYSNCRRLRRLDSLAELLELDSTLSVCSAVTIVGDQMLLSANTSGVFTNYEIANLTRQKLLIIREFLASKQSVAIIPFSEFIHSDKKLSSSSAATSSDTDISDGDEHLELDEKTSSEDENESALQAYYQTNLDLLASEEELRSVVLQLNSVSNSTHDDNDSVQNLFKLLKSFYLDIGPFSTIEKQVILTSDVRMLLPYLEHSTQPNSVCLNIEQFILTQEDIRTFGTYIAVDGFPDSARQSNFHCEQLLLYFLKQNVEVEAAQIGISKGCCVTCDNLFKRHPTFEVRGTSSQLYPNTVNIFDLTKFDHSGSPVVYPQKGCRHRPSPKDTPGVMGSPGSIGQGHSSTASAALFALGKACSAPSVLKDKRKISDEEHKSEPDDDSQEDDLNWSELMLQHGLHRNKKLRRSQTTNLEGESELDDHNSEEDGQENDSSNLELS